jgi:ABC-type glycerol-3-phosphate transport system permease component
MLSKIVGQWLPGADKPTGGVHPFRRRISELDIGYTLKTDSRTVTLEDIEHFAHFTGDTFYAHMDEEAAKASPIFEGRVAHGYLILSFAAGLFVEPAPGPVLVLPQYLLATHTGIVNTYWALLIPMLVNPFGVYLGRVFAEGYVPNETLEAARADGAGEGRIFRSVALPMLVPGFVTVFLFSFTASWNNVILPLMMLNDESLYPVTLGLAGWSESSHVHPEFYAMTITGSLVAIVPLVLAFVCLQRFWRAGLTAGAVK